tara:strand:- start:319 stop:462 length:144 start_codon:yes stop_codon:yes gene_type:complete
MENMQIETVMTRYGCNAEDAHRYLDLIEEGYTRYQAAIMAGLADPDC